MSEKPDLKAWNAACHVDDEGELVLVPTAYIKALEAVEEKVRNYIYYDKMHQRRIDVIEMEQALAVVDAFRREHPDET